MTATRFVTSIRELASLCAAGPCMNPVPVSVQCQLAAACEPACEPTDGLAGMLLVLTGHGAYGIVGQCQAGMGLAVLSRRH
jgi:hypothetical protein